MVKYDWGGGEVERLRNGCGLMYGRGAQRCCGLMCGSGAQRW